MKAKVLLMNFYYVWKKDRTRRFLSRVGEQVTRINELGSLEEGILAVIREIGGFEAVDIQNSESYYERRIRLSGLIAYAPQIYRADVSRLGRLRITNDRWMRNSRGGAYVFHDYDLRNGIYVLKDESVLEAIAKTLSDDSKRMGRSNGVN